jgi:hypothetical protein
MSEETLKELEARRREWEAEGGRTNYWAPRQDISPAVRHAVNKRAKYRCEISERCDSLQLHHMHYRSVGYELPRNTNKAFCDPRL